MNLVPESPFDILGIEIPSSSSVFLSVLAVHVVFGLTCAVAGFAAIFTKKGSSKHILFGNLYFWGLFVVFITATALSIMRWAEDYYLFVLGFLSFSLAVLGKISFRIKKKKKTVLHLVLMGMSFILLLTAFYVDNGKNLPLWKLLPPISYWLIPALIGLPVIVRSVIKYYQHP